jgi:signal transduction histidine kinase
VFGVKLKRSIGTRLALGYGDEFARLSVDINRMLDRIEQLMDGVRHVSNAIAHDLRTPLSRIRSRLDDALRRDMTSAALSEAVRTAIVGIDDLILVFNKLLQIAGAESGLRTESFETVDLNRIVQDMVELYDAAADVQRVQLHIVSREPVWARGDRDLLVSAVASLIDNALKYAGPGCRVELGAYPARDRGWQPDITSPGARNGALSSSGRSIAHRHAKTCGKYLIRGSILLSCA